MCGDIISLTGMCAYVFFCLKIFSIFISSMVSMSRYNLHRQALWRTIIFKTVMVPTLKGLRNATIKKNSKYVMKVAVRFQKTHH